MCEWCKKSACTLIIGKKKKSCVVIIFESPTCEPGHTNVSNTYKFYTNA